MSMLDLNNGRLSVLHKQLALSKQCSRDFLISEWWSLLHHSNKGFPAKALAVLYCNLRR